MIDILLDLHISLYLITYTLYLPTPPEFNQDFPLQLWMLMNQIYPDLPRIECLDLSITPTTYGKLHNNNNAVFIYFTIIYLIHY